MKKFLLWAAALPLLLALILAVGCSEAPRTPKQARDEARQAADAGTAVDIARKLVGAAA